MRYIKNSSFCSFINTGEVVIMDMSMPTIEKLTGTQLRKLAIWPPEQQTADEDFYAEDFLLELEDNDELSIEESGIMMGYLGSDY